EAVREIERERGAHDEHEQEVVLHQEPRVIDFAAAIFAAVAARLTVGSTGAARAARSPTAPARRDWPRCPSSSNGSSSSGGTRDAACPPVPTRPAPPARADAS